jgi:PQ loop repeat
MANMLGTFLNAQLPTQKLAAVVFFLTDCMLMMQYAVYHKRHGRYQSIPTEPDEDTADRSASPTRSVTEVPSTTRCHIATISTAAVVVGICAASTVDATPIITAFKEAVLPLCNATLQTSETATMFGYAMSWLSGSFYFFSRIPQIYHNYQRRSVKGLSRLLFVLTILGMCV